MVSPGCSYSLIQFEKRPPGTLRTPTRSSPSSTPAQIEYERRTSCRRCSLRSVRYWPCVKRKTSRRSLGHVEGDDHRLVGVGRDAAHAQRMEDGGGSSARVAVASDRLEVFERLAAGAGSGRAPCRRSSRRRRGARCRGCRSAGRRAHSAAGAARSACGAVAVAASRARAARCRSRAACGGPSSLIQSVVQAGARRMLDARRAEARAVERADDARARSPRSPGSRSRSA